MNPGWSKFAVKASALATPLVLAAAVQGESMTISGYVDLKDTGEHIAIARTVLKIDESNKLPVKAGVVLTLRPNRQPDGNLKYSALLERVRPDGGKEVLTTPPIVSPPDRNFGVQGNSFGYGFQIEK